MQQGLARLFSCSLAVTLRSPDLDRLDAATTAVLEAAERLDAQAWPADLEHLQGFHTTLPLGIDALERRQTLDTTALALSFPLLDDTVSMDHGQLWGVGATRPKPVLLDLRDREHGGPPAPHAILAGPSGGGKTMTFISIALQQLTAGDCDKAFAIDPKREGYAGPALHAGGQVVYLNPSTETTLNAFDLPPEEDANGVRIDPVLEQTGYLLGFLRLLLCREGDDLDAEEYGLLEQCVVVAYRRAGITSGNPETWGRPAPVLSDLYDVLGEFADATAKGLSRRLYPYAKGTLARLFSQPTTPGLLGRPVRRLRPRAAPGDLRPAAAYLIINHIWREARRVKQRILVGLDETRTLLDAESSARLVGDVFTKGRCAGVQVLSMSQSVLDYTQNAQGLRALETTFCTAAVPPRGGAGPPGGAGAVPPDGRGRDLPPDGADAQGGGACPGGAVHPPGQEVDPDRPGAAGAGVEGAHRRRRRPAGRGAPPAAGVTMFPTPAARTATRSPLGKRDGDLVDRIFALAVTLAPVRSCCPCCRSPAWRTAR